MAQETDEATPGTGMPGWAKVTLLLAGLALLLMIVVMTASGGNHGPGRHTGGIRTGPPQVSAPLA